MIVRVHMVMFNCCLGGIQGSRRNQVWEAEVRALLFVDLSKVV